MSQRPTEPEYTIQVVKSATMSTRSLVSNLEKFTGKNEISVENWCDLVEDAFTIEDWTDKQKLVLASQQLAGAAATWYAAARKGATPPNRWEELRTGLLQRFGGTRSAAVSRLEIGRLRWREDQDLEDHITQFTAIRSRISDASDSELVSYFQQTLPPDYLSDSLYRDPDTLEQAIAYTRSLHASRHHGFHNPLPATKAVPVDSTGPAPMDLDIQQLVRALNSLGIRTNGSQTGGGGDNRKCYRCGIRGHIARFCPQRQNIRSNGQRRPYFRNQRLAELTYTQEQQQPPPPQQQQSPLPPLDFVMNDMSRQGKGPSQ
jgi:hypothetical protein